MAIIQVTHAADPRIADYRNVPDGELLKERGLFVAEGRLVVSRLLASRAFSTRSILVTTTAFTALSETLAESPGDLPVFVASQQILNDIVGFNIHRGCLAIGERPPAVPLSALLPRFGEGSLVTVLEGVGNADNVGGIFRNAAAFGCSAVLLGPGCCDPLYRKATRVSVAATLQVPFSVVERWPEDLRLLGDAGFVIVALTPDRTAPKLEAVTVPPSRRMALLLGSEGQGLSPEARGAADVEARIETADVTDSLNVATAAGIAFHRFSQLVR
jgi:tRNA G18 (ribose-2'-O)-methylase SpoU